MRRGIVLGGLLLASLGLCACGYTEQEMAAKQREIDALTREVRTLRAAAAPSASGRAAAKLAHDAPQRGRAVAAR